VKIVTLLLLIRLSCFSPSVLFRFTVNYVVTIHLNIL
jgi:hypothetical protein